MLENELRAVYRNLKDLEKHLRRNDDREGIKRTQQIIKLVGNLISKK